MVIQEISPTLFRLALVAVGVLLFFQPIRAKCSPLPSVFDAFNSGAIVFDGEVTAIEATRMSGPVSYRGNIFMFTVAELFKGNLDDPVRIVSYAASGESYYDFKLHVRYLVYAWRNHKTDELIASGCTRTKPFSLAAKEIVTLRSISRYKQYK